MYIKIKFNTGKTMKNVFCCVLHCVNGQRQYQIAKSEKIQILHYCFTLRYTIKLSDLTRTMWCDVYR